MPSSHRTLASALVALLLATPAFAQNTPPAERVIRMSGTVTGAPGQQATVRFAIYDAESGGTRRSRLIKPASTRRFSAR